MAEHELCSKSLNITLRMTHPMDFSMILNSSEDDNDNISSPEESEEDDSGKSHDGRADTMHFDTILHPSQNSKSSYADQQRPNHDVQTASKDNSTSFSFEPEKPSLFSPMEWNLEARKLPRPSSMLEQPDIGDYFRSTQKYETQSLIGRTQALHVRSSTTESRQVSRSNSTHDVSQEMHPVKMEVPRQPNGNGYYASERLYEPHYLDRPHVFDRKGSSPEFWRSGRGSPTLQSEASSNLPSLKRETSQPPNFIGYSGPEEGSETPTKSQGSHIPNPILDSRKPVRRSSSHGEPRGVQKHHRALPTRTILPQTHRNDGMISQRGQRDARTSSGRSCSYPGGELISPSQYFGRTKTSKAKPAHSNKACMVSLYLLQVSCRKNKLLIENRYSRASPLDPLHERGL